MSISVSKSKLNHVAGENVRDIVYLTIIFFIVGINLMISYFVRESSFIFLANPNPIGFSFGYYSSASIIILVTWAVFYFRLLLKTPVYTILVLSGIYANFMEKLLWGSVADYISTGTLYFNLSDIQIVIGIVMINLQVWFSSSQEVKLEKKAV